MDKRAYWLWVQHAFGVGSPKVGTILRRFGSAAAFFEEGKGFWQACGFVSERECTALSAFSPDKAAAMLEYCEKTGQQVLTPEDAAYPERLRQLFDPPAALFVRGELPPVDTILTVAVVGSRKADERGLKAAGDISSELAAAGVVVVSGGAVGIDAAAHRGALRGGGKTVCVLPCGMNYPYLMDNAAMREEIAATGALLTEYPENAGVFRGNFQLRNRLISGLAHGVLVVCAAEKSGTMMTVARATEQNRDLFVFPGTPGDPHYAGAAALLEDGALPVHSADDIIREYAPLLAARAQQVAPAQAAPTAEKVVPVRQAAGEDVNNLKTEENRLDELSADAVTLWVALEQQERHINDLALRTGLPAGRVLAALTELEIAGLCESHAGRMYRRVIS